MSYVHPNAEVISVHAVSGQPPEREYRIWPDWRCDHFTQIGTTEKQVNEKLKTTGLLAFDPDTGEILHYSIQYWHWQPGYWLGGAL
jgi:hypothetical protein